MKRLAGIKLDDESLSIRRHADALLVDGERIAKLLLMVDSGQAEFRGVTRDDVARAHEQLKRDYAKLEAKIINF